jgi:CubicO group peptidase (beta-lactamase class C family)
MYFPGIRSFVQGDIPFLDGEVPAANGVVTGRGLAKMYAAIANGGVIDGEQFLSADLVDGLIGKPRVWPDLNLVVPMPFHLGYHESPIPGLLKGFGHIGLGGTLGWADPSTGSAFCFVHNRLLTAMVLDMGAFAGIARPLRNAITAARSNGAMTVPRHGATFRDAGEHGDAPKRKVSGRR